jgi:acetyl-CoA carboxylase alpha subunit
MTAQDMLKLGLVDAIIPEPGEGAHTDADAAAEFVRVALRQSLAELSIATPSALMAERYRKFREMGAFFQEGAGAGR